MFAYYNYYISIELKFLKELMIIGQANQKSVMFVTIGIQNEGFMFQPNVCNRCHDLLMMPRNICDIAILNIKSSAYHCVISGISRNEAINVMQNSD